MIKKEQPVDIETSLVGLHECYGDEPIRRPLLDERKSRTVRFTLTRENEKKEITEIKGYFTVGCYPDGTPGEVFIRMGKHGHELHGLADMWSIALSLLLQFGVPPAKVYEKFKYQEFQPSGISGVPDVPVAKSLVDLVVRWMEAKLPPTAKTGLPLNEADAEWQQVVEEVSTAPQGGE